MRPDTTTTFAIRGPIARDDVPGLYQRACGLLAAAGPGVLVCELSDDVAADAVAVDALARLSLATRRHGCQLRVVGTSPELRDLIAFMGLSEVLLD